MAYFPEYALDLINTNRDGMLRRIVGSLHLPSGRLVACDPFLLDEEAFSRVVQPGRYLVELCITTERAIAAAIIRFGSSEAVKLEMALTDKQVITQLDDNEFYGYGVDVGRGCFTSIEFLEFFRKNESLQLDFQSEVRGEDWINYKLKDDPSLNLIAFSSGDGDGSYPSYWGLSRRGKPVCLFTDFMILDESKDGYFPRF